MNKFSKTLSFIIVFLLIVCASFIIYIIFITPISKASNSNSKNNISDELTLTDTEDKIIFVNLKEKIEQTAANTTSTDNEQQVTKKENNINNTQQQNTTTNAPANSVAVTSTVTYPEGWLTSFHTQIEQLKQEFPSGYYWNDANGTGNGGVTQTPCNHSYNTYYCNLYLGNSTIIGGLGMGTQCAGFSSMLSDRIFGKDTPAKIFYNYDDIRIGDQARINNNSHTVFIIDKTDEYVIIAECNADYNSCIINWGRKIYRKNLTGYYITRWQ